VQLGRQPAQPFHQLVALEAAEGRRQAAGGRLVGHVLQDHLVFGKQAAVVQLQRRHITLGTERAEILATARLLGAQADALGGERQAGGQQGDMWGKRTGAGTEIELHDSPDKWTANQADSKAYNISANTEHRTDRLRILAIIRTCR